MPGTIYIRDANVRSYAEVSFVVLSKPIPVKKNIKPNMEETVIILTLCVPLPEFIKSTAAITNPIIPKTVSITPNIFFSIFCYNYRIGYYNDEAKKFL
jgi:hypothetical protein